MKKTRYYIRAYKKGNTGRKGPVALKSTADDISDAIKKLQKWIWLHEDLYYYTIDRKIIIENE